METKKEFEFSPEVLEVAEFARLMSHPVRVYIMEKLSGLHSCCYSSSLLEELPIAKSTLSQHLKELKYGGLIQGETEPPYIKYCINQDKWDEMRRALADFMNL